jgi:hypothetical protein
MALDKPIKVIDYDIEYKPKPKKVKIIKVKELTKSPSKQTTGLNRETIDKFYTKYDAVNLCIYHILENLNIDKTRDLIIEPSAGNGAFIDSIEKEIGSSNNLYYDIEPENSKIKRQDFLELNTDKFKIQYNRIHIIGNPPFGRQSSIAVKFIKKSCNFSDSFSFILPKSFKKDSFKSKIPLNFHLVFEIDLPEKSFLLNGKDYDVPCVFQIWEKRTIERDPLVILEPLEFEFVKKKDDPDISFRRVGVYAGAIDTNTADKSVQSHYFIRFFFELTEGILKKLKEIKYEFNNTVGPKSISKQELIAKFNKIISEEVK